MQREENKTKPTTETQRDQPGSATEAFISVPSRENDRPAATVGPQQLAGPAPCPTCGSVPASQAPSYVYAVGTLQQPFAPSPGVAQELQRVIGQAQTKGKTDWEATQAVLREPENFYLLKELCFVMEIQGLAAYLLMPRDSEGWKQLSEAALRPNRSTNLVAVVGELGPIAPREKCGVWIPTLVPDTIYWFEYDKLLASIPRPAKMTARQFEPTADQVFKQLTGSTGRTDVDRVKVYMALSVPQAYAIVAQQFAANASLSAIEVRRSSLSDTRATYKVSMVFTDRKTGVTQTFCAEIDATEKYVFPVTDFSPCYDR